MSVLTASLKRLVQLLGGGDRDLDPDWTDRGSADAGRKQLGDIRHPAAATVMAGSIQLLGMADIKKQLGQRWTAVAASAGRIAEETIRRHLSTDDAYQRHGEDAFVLCFASPDKGHAEARTKAIVAEITQRLGSENPGIALRVDHTVAELEWADLDDAEGSIAEIIARELREVREKAEAAARAWRRELLRSAGIRFNPIWSPRERTVMAFRATLDEQTGRHAMGRLSSVTTPDDLKTTLHELDCLIVGRAVKGLDRLLQEGGKARVVVPVNVNSLSTKAARDAYLNLCRDIPQAHSRFVLFELHGATAGTPVTRLVEIALALRPFCLGVVVETPAAGAELQKLSEARVLGISVDDKALPRGAAQSSAALKRLAAAASALEMKVFMHGADTVGSLESARQAPVDYVDGRAVDFPLTDLKSAYRWIPK